jgi:hypothetical protein
MIWQSNVQGSVSDKVVLNSELLYVGSFDMNAYALDAQTGEIRWSSPAEAAVWGAPLYVDGVVYFADLSGNVYAVGAESGEKIWSTTVESAYVVAQPVYADGKVFIASAGDPAEQLGDRSGALVALDAETGEQLWRETTARPLFTTPVIVGDTVVVAEEDLENLLVYISFDGDTLGTFPRPTNQ